MRFSSVAVILLSHTLPTWSTIHFRAKNSQLNIRPRTLQTKNDIIRAAQENRLTAPQRRLAFHLNYLKGLSNGRRILKANVYCDPTSTDPDIGILSCGDSHMCQASLGPEFGGICVPKDADSVQENQSSSGKGFMGLLPKASRHVPLVNDSDAAANPVACDPTSSDIGILACEKNHVCKVDESSELGGFCSSASVTSRRLDIFWLYYYLCDETFPYFISGCDCTGIDPSTGTGIIDCSAPLYSISAECRGIPLEASGLISVENSSATSYTDCIEMVTYHYQKACFTTNVSEESGFLTLNGQPCSLNDDDPIYDCSNVEGGGAGQYLWQVLPNMSECLFDYSFNCTICNAGNSMAYAFYDINVTIPGIGERSCLYLALAEYLALIPYDECPVVSEAAQNSCCAYQCDLCGPGAYIPVENDDVPLNLPVPGYEGLTCGNFASAAYVNFSIPDGRCSSFAGLVQQTQTCCQALSDECSLCDGLLTNPHANVTVDGNSVQCASLQSFLTAQECRAVLPNVSPVCCAASTASVPVGTPTAAPTTTAGAAGTVTPHGSEDVETPDAATGILTQGGLLSSVGGVMLAAFLVVASC